MKHKAIGITNGQTIISSRVMSEELFETVEPKTWSFLLTSLKKHEPENRHGFWTDGEQILCRTEGEAKAVADFLEDLGFDCVMTGYYDPEEDAESDQTDDHTGYWYASID